MGLEIKSHVLETGGCYVSRTQCIIYKGKKKILKDEAGVNISKMNWWTQVEIIVLSLEIIIPFQLLFHDMTARGRARSTVPY